MPSANPPHFRKAFATRSGRPVVAPVTKIQPCWARTVPRRSASCLSRAFSDSLRASFSEAPMTPTTGLPITPPSTESDDLIAAQLSDRVRVVTQIHHDRVTIFSEFRNFVVAGLTVGHLKRVGDHRDFSDRRVRFSYELASDNLWVGEHLRDTAHFAVGQLGFLELYEPMAVILFQKNLLDGLFQFVTVFSPPFDSGNARVF